MSKQKKWTEAQLIEAVKNNTSMRQTLLSLGLCGKGGGNYQNIEKYIKKLNLDTSHWMRQASSRGKILNSRKKIPLEKVLVENSSYSRQALKRRLIKQNILKYKCENCGINEWMKKPITLQLEHKNGIHNDNRLENLCLLCPNCHSQTSTFAGKNNKTKKIINYCLDCSKEIAKQSKRCIKCFNANRKKSKN